MGHPADERNWTVYLRTPAGKLVEFDDWTGRIGTLNLFVAPWGWKYVNHSEKLGEVTFQSGGWS